MPSISFAPSGDKGHLAAKLVLLAVGKMSVRIYEHCDGSNVLRWKLR